MLHSEITRERDGEQWQRFNSEDGTAEGSVAELPAAHAQSGSLNYVGSSFHEFSL
jgi:hypothetical protein